MDEATGLLGRVFDYLETIDSDYCYLAAGAGAYGMTTWVRPELLFIIAPAFAIVARRVKVIRCRIKHHDLKGKQCPYNRR